MQSRSGESHVSLSCGPFSRLFTNRRGTGPETTVQVLKVAAAYFVVRYCVLPCVVALLCLHPLHALDRHRQSASPEMNSLARGVAVTGAGGKQGWLLRAVGVEPRHPDKALAPSAVIGLLLLTVLELIGGAWESARALFLNKADDLAMDRAEALWELFRSLGLEASRSPYATVLVRACSRRLGGARPYVCEPDGTPLMRRTCGVLLACRLLGAGFEARGMVLAWLKRCEAPEGGFGPAPGYGPTAQHTAAALQTLGGEGCLTADQARTHRSWLTREVRAALRCGDRVSPGQWLRWAGFLADGLSALGGLPLRAKRLRALFTRRAITCWNASRRGTCETQCLFRCLELGGDDVPHQVERLRSGWIKEAEARWVTLTPEPHLQELAEAIAIEQWLFPGDYRSRAAVQRIADNVEHALGGSKG
jgi:hypothetical protein